MAAVTLVMIARVPAAGVADFQTYEGQVLPLLARHGGRLERRLRNGDGTVELHVVTFGSRQQLERFRADPDRRRAAPLLDSSAAAMEVIEVTDLD